VRLAFIIAALYLLLGCDNSKWESISTSGISDSPMSIDQAIYFENMQNGLLGGYYFEASPGKNAEGAQNFLERPLLFYTRNGGKDWRKVPLNSSWRGNLDAVILSRDTILCKIQNHYFRSNHLGYDWQAAEPQDTARLLNQHQIENSNIPPLLSEGEPYYVKEIYRAQHTLVYVCYGKDVLTDYYFVSHDSGMHWRFLQKDFGSNNAKFLLGDQYLLMYESPYGLRRLALQ